MAATFLTEIFRRTRGKEVQLSPRRKALLNSAQRRAGISGRGRGIGRGSPLPDRPGPIRTAQACSSGTDERLEVYTTVPGPVMTIIGSRVRGDGKGSDTVGVSGRGAMGPGPKDPKLPMEAPPNRTFAGSNSRHGRCCSPPDRRGSR